MFAHHPRRARGLETVCDCQAALRAPVGLAVVRAQPCGELGAGTRWVERCGFLVPAVFPLLCGHVSCVSCFIPAPEAFFLPLRDHPALQHSGVGWECHLGSSGFKVIVLSIIPVPLAIVKNTSSF